MRRFTLAHLSVNFLHFQMSFEYKWLISTQVARFPRGVR
jgi:hypothetical protein